VNPLHYIGCFTAGLFFCNGIPHLTCGLRGEPFPSPFSKPPGIGLSSALVNFFWGASNIAIGVFLLLISSFVLGLNLESALFAIAFLIIGIPTSRHFEKVRLAKQPTNEARIP
jgi:hypothetical protein